jgi:hypothetical protein
MAGILLLPPAREVLPASSSSAPPSASEAFTAPDGFLASPEISGRPATEPSPAEVFWEDQLDTILSSGTDDATVVRRLLDGLASRPAEARPHFVAHALGLAGDADYARFEQLYLAGNTSPEVAREIFHDALNRPDEIKLPLLAKTMRQPGHPMAGEAREILEIYLGLAPGALPPAGWEEAVRQYLAATPADPAGVDP